MSVLSPPLVVFPDRAGGFLVFGSPSAVFAGPDLVEAETVARATGAWLAGGLQYAEAETPASGWWGVFDQPAVFSRSQLQAEADASPVFTGPLTAGPTATYEEAFRAVHEALSRGVTYQTNLTFATGGVATAAHWTWRSALRLWLDLTAEQGREAVFAVLGSEESPSPVLVSASPELFFSRQGDRVETRPMKGTAPRHADPALDAAHRFELATSAKTRAENLMVTDMLRNDLGRLAVPGGVTVPQLFEVEEYPTVWQMTSTIRADLRPGTGLAALMSALFPCASITGAPKLSTQSVIARVEEAPRGWYTGTLGWYKPDSALTGPDRGRFSVLIRTLVFGNGPAFSLGVGGGVVWDSTASGEYEEAWAKTKFLHMSHRNFNLTETVLWEPETGLFLLGEHETRLAAACRDFGGRLEDGRLKQALEDEVERLRALGPGPFRLRVLVDPSFSLRVEGFTVDSMPDTLTAALAAQPLGPDTSLWRRYKTTNRSIYEVAKIPGVDQIIHYNERGELTESTSMNLVLEREGQLVTPALSCGLLDGTYRASLIAEGRITEAVLPIETLRDASKIWLVNSVRRWKLAKLIAP